jgi:hypothetical protein
MKINWGKSSENIHFNVEKINVFSKDPENKRICSFLPQKKSIFFQK